MSDEQDALSIDLIRWTFTVNPEHRGPIEDYLLDMGLDVLIYDDAKFIVTWEEPERDVDEVIETMWTLNGGPFDVTQEEFHRLGLHILQNDEGAATQTDEGAATQDAA